MADIGYDVAAQNAANEEAVKRMNDTLTTIYNNEMNGYNANIAAGREPGMPLPDVPKGWTLSMPDVYGVKWPVQGTAPVCPKVPVGVDHRKTQQQLDVDTGANHISIGAALGGGWWATNADDTCPSGFTTPPLPAGPTWPEGTIFRKVSFFMGKGWWQKVN